MHVERGAYFVRIDAGDPEADVLIERCQVEAVDQLLHEHAQALLTCFLIAVAGAAGQGFDGRLPRVVKAAHACASPAAVLVIPVGLLARPEPETL